MERNYNILDEHWDLMVKELSGNANESDVIELKKLLSESIVLQQEYKSLEKLWNNAIGEELASVDIDKAWDAVQHNAHIEHPDLKVRRIYPLLLKIAAVFVLALGVWSVYNINSDKTTYLTAQNEPKTVTLPDGSVVDLYKGASLSFNNSFNEKNRSVSLVGEAFFSIAHNKANPFIITAGNSLIRVTGTAFMVSINRSKDVAVTVQSGSVEFSSVSNAVPIKLTIGDKGCFSALSGKLTKQNNTDLNYDSWKTKKLIFKNTPIQEVLKVVNKTYLSSFVADGNSDSLCLTATFEAQPLINVKEILEKTFAIELKINKEKQY